MHGRHRRFAPSFVVTVSALAVACSKPPSNEAIEPVTDPVKKADSGKVELPPPENPPSPKLTKKRVRTSKSPPKWEPASGMVPYEDFVAQNPTDSEGRTIFVSFDDTCFVQMPKKNQPKALPPGMPWYDTLLVDCPTELDDPAWDDCSGGTLEAVKGKSGECYCVHPGGNPPPPPNVVACPKHKK
ncbi:MAG: hypothetical protein ACXWUE_15230 [Polyangiales bacterium]